MRETNILVCKCGRIVLEEDYRTTGKTKCGHYGKDCLKKEPVYKNWRYWVTMKQVALGMRPKVIRT